MHKKTFSQSFKPLLLDPSRFSNRPMTMCRTGVCASSLREEITDPSATSQCAASAGEAGWAIASCAGLCLGVMREAESSCLECPQ